ncbi:p450 domain containing protein, partial [Asbolus verrucosus]
CRLNYYASKLVGPPAFPLIGSAFYFYGGTQSTQVKSLNLLMNSNPVSEIFETAMRIAEKYKPLFKFWCGTKFVVIITDPEDVKIILNSCLEKDNYYEFAIPALGYGLITLPAREWSRHRKIIIESKKRAKYQMKDFYDGIAKKKVLLDHLIDLTYKEGNWSDKELKEEIKTIITAGSETTASTVGYVLTILGMRQDIQDLVLEEIDSITGSSGKDIAVEDLSKMTYLDRVIKETLRLFPIVGMIGRYLDNNINLKNCILPRGSSVGIPIIFIHRLPEFWANPLMFDPDRFLPEEVAKRHPYTFLPFSGGPRNC